MTNEEKKQYLKAYRRLQNDIDQKLGECEKWRCLAEKATAVISNTPKGHGANRIESAVEHVIVLEKQIDEEIDQLISLRRKIEKAIYGIPDNTLRMIMKYRYIDGDTWEAIAEKIHYSYRNVCYMHGKALNLINIA